MDQDYDYIVLGTGLKECILSGLLSVNKHTVLHMDRNNYYGAESASLNLEQLYEKFEPDGKMPASFGRSRDYNIDLCPKFIMACGNLVKILLHTKVTRYLEFRSVGGSYVYKDGGVHKVPSTPTEALNSSLMGFFQKRNFRDFATFINNYEADKPATYEEVAGKIQKSKGKAWKDVTCQDVFDYFSLDANTVAFTGHAVALYEDDRYLNSHCAEMLERVKLYTYSMARYGNSPYIYPLWGLGGLPEGFSRLSAIHGGVYMLNKPIEEIIYDKDGKVTGVKSGGEIARCKKLLADPTYFIGTDKVKKVGQVAKAICILGGPLPNTENKDSCQIILPGSSLNRKSDVYCFCVSSSHKVAAEGKYIAVVSTTVETKDAHEELTPALKLLGKIEKEFFFVSDLYAPTGDGSKDNVFITSSYDPSSHFESATEEVIRLYEKLTGKPIDLSIAADLEATEETS